MISEKNILTLKLKTQILEIIKNGQQEEKKNIKRPKM